MTKNEIVLEVLSNPEGRVEILGFGVSNIPLTLMLHDRIGSHRLLVRDKKSRLDLDVPDKLSDVLFLESPDPTSGLGDLDNLRKTVIFRSPGIRPDMGEIPKALKKGATLYSEMEWFVASTPADIFAITGSDGKTTTTTLTNLLLSKSGKTTYIGGNIGTPLLDKCDRMKRGDIAVLELSSFQLMTMKGGAKRAAITNITPNHLNWHRDMSEYVEAKYNVFDENTQLLVVNSKNDLSAGAALRYSGNVTFFTAKNEPGDTFSSLTHNRPDSDLIYLEGDEIVYTDGVRREVILNRNDILLPGLHNVENFMTAIALTRGIADNETIKNVAKTFGGVKHRFEYIRTCNGVKFYNSSIDSTPTRTCAALSNLDIPTVCICGGQDKHVSFEPLAKALLDKTVAVVLTGEAMPLIKKAIDEERTKRKEPVLLAPEKVILEPDFEKAVKKAYEIAENCGMVLLSPACTSFDCFKNFEERGERFKEIVSELI